MTLHVPILLILGAPAGAATPDSLEDPRTRGLWVLDSADLWSEAREGELHSAAERLHRGGGPGVALVSVDWCPTTPAMLARQLRERWALPARSAVIVVDAETGALGWDASPVLDLEAPPNDPIALLDALGTAAPAEPAPPPSKGELAVALGAAGAWAGIVAAARRIVGPAA